MTRHAYETVEEVSYEVQHDNGTRAIVDLIAFDHECGDCDKPFVGWLAFWRGTSPEQPITADMLRPTPLEAMGVLGGSAAEPPASALIH